VPYGWFLVASGLCYGGISLCVRSERTWNELSLFLILLGTAGALWWKVVVRGRRPAPRLTTVLFGALFLRLLVVPAGYDFDRGHYQRLILYDDDVWRYLWEGHVWGGDVNPMRVAPAALEEYQLEIDSPELFHRLYDRPDWANVWDNIGYREIASPYPIVAHAVFRLSARLRPGSVATFKLLMIACDLGAIWALAIIARRIGQSTRAAAIYAWCPLPIKEFAGSGHVDALMIFLMLLALLAGLRWRSGWLSGLLAGLGSLVKPTALAVAPGLLHRNGVAAAVGPAVAAGLLAAFPPDGLKVYARYWVFNPVLPRLLPDERWLEVGLTLAVAGAAAAWRWRDSGDSDVAALRSPYWILGAFLLTTPMLAPWYLCWILPFAALFRGVFWLLLSISIFLSYHAHLAMEESFWLWTWQFLAPALGYLWLLREGSGRPPLGEP